MKNKRLSGSWIGMALGASQMGFFVAGGLLMGLWLDGYWGTRPWLGLLGLLFGFAAGIRFLIRLVHLSERESDDDGE